MNRLLSSTLTTLVLIGTLGMTPANTTTHREVMTSDSRTAAQLRRGTSASVGPERVKPVGRGWRPSAEPFDSASAASAALVPPDSQRAGDNLRTWPSVNAGGRDGGTGKRGEIATLGAIRPSGFDSRSRPPASSVEGAAVVRGSAATRGQLTSTAPSASTGRWRGTFCQGWWLGENLTPAIWNANPERGRRMMVRLVNCVFHRFAPAQVVTALIIADRESGFYPWAQNPSSLCSGIYQHILSAWDSRARTYLWRGWFAPWVWVPSWADPRANIIVAAKMVVAGGWGPWSTA